MTDIVELYCRIVNEGAGFDDPRLVELRACMTEEELERVNAQLTNEAIRVAAAVEAGMRGRQQPTRRSLAAD
jgi:hypothetical protein